MRLNRFRFRAFASGSTWTAFRSFSIVEDYTPGGYLARALLRDGVSPLFLSQCSSLIHGSRILPAIRSIRASHAAVVSSKRLTQVAGVIEVVRQHCHAVTDVGVDVEQIRRPAAPLPG